MFDKMLVNISTMDVDSNPKLDENVLDDLSWFSRQLLTDKWYLEVMFDVFSRNRSYFCYVFFK